MHLRHHLMPFVNANSPAPGPGSGTLTPTNIQHARNEVAAMSHPLPPFLKQHFLDRTLKTLPLHKAVTLQKDDPLEKALSLFVEQRIGSVLVLDGETLKGIVTERDLVLKLDPFTLTSRTLGSLMTPNPQTLSVHASIARALYTFSAGGFRHVPVLSTSSQPLQVCSLRDVIDFIYERLASRFLSQEYEIEEVADERAVQNFFESPVTILEPRRAHTISIERSSYDALLLLRLNGIGSVVVVDNGSRLRGIVTERDYLNKLLVSGKDPASVSIEGIMTANPLTVLDSSSVSRALNFLCEGRFRHLPVVDHSESLVGMLSVKDFAHFLARRIVAELE